MPYFISVLLAIAIFFAGYYVGKRVKVKVYSKEEIENIDKHLKKHDK